MSYFHPTAEIEEDCKIGEQTRIWHLCHIRSGSIIGKNCVLGRNVYVEAGAFIGDGVHIQNNVSVYSGVQLLDGVFVGPSVVFTNDKYPHAGGQDWTISPTIVREGASIGAGSVIIPGITIGKGAMIGAGSVVVRDVLPNETYIKYGKSRVET